MACFPLTTVIITEICQILIRPVRSTSALNIPSRHQTRFIVSVIRIIEYISITVRSIKTVTKFVYDCILINLLRIREISGSHVHISKRILSVLGIASICNCISYSYVFSPS